MASGGYLMEASWTITQATDWPMFLIMVGVLGTVFSVLWGIVVLLLRSYHKAVLTRIDEKFDSVINQISEQKINRKNHCKECHSTLTKKFAGIWRHLRRKDLQEIEVEQAG
jgi:hypothetical protein